MVFNALILAFAAGSLTDEFDSNFDHDSTAELDITRRLLFCSYSFSGYCGGPRVKAVSDFTLPAPEPTLKAPAFLFCSYSFSGYCGGPRTAAAETQLESKRDRCRGVSETWAENTAHVLHSATLGDLRKLNPTTPVANGIPTLSRDLLTVLENVPEVDFGAAFNDPLVNRLAYHLAVQYAGDLGGLMANWRPQDILVHVLHMNEVNIEVARHYKSAKPSRETCKCLAAQEDAITKELEHIAKYFKEVPAKQLQRNEWNPADWKDSNWNINLSTFLKTKENTDGMDMEKLTSDAANYLKCKLAAF